MIIYDILLILVIVFLFSLLLSHLATYLEIFDHPNARSLHRQSVPRVGGLAVIAGIFAGSAWESVSIPSVHTILLMLLPGLLPLGIISVLDDKYGISARSRILVHLWAAVSLSAGGLTLGALSLPGFILPLSSEIAVLLVTSFTIWMINLYNFMDGMDGFAGGMAVIGFTTLAWLGRADVGFAAFCLIIMAASTGFLIRNLPPAKIFLGDVGSTTLGFLAAVCSLWGEKTGLFPLWVAVLVFSPFIVDATVTLLRRLLRGEKVWKAHRSHYYQRLVLLGWGHRRTVLAEYALMLACAGSALVAVRWQPASQWILIIGWALIYGLLIEGVRRLEQRRATVAP